MSWNRLGSGGGRLSRYHLENRLDERSLEVDGELRVHRVRGPGVDAAPTAGSPNLVTSGGVRAALDSVSGGSGGITNVNANLIADGSVTNAEFQQLSGLDPVNTIQEQLHAVMQASAFFLIPGTDATNIADGSVSNAEFQQLNGLGTVNTIQEQLDGKQASGWYLTDVPEFTNANLIADGSVSNAEFQHLSGATSNVQAQFASLAVVDSGHDARLATLEGAGYLTAPLNANQIANTSVTNAEFQQLNGLNTTITIETRLFGLEVSYSGQQTRLANVEAEDIVHDTRLTSLETASTSYLVAGTDATNIGDGSVTNAEFNQLNGLGPLLHGLGQTDVAHDTRLTALETAGAGSYLVSGTDATNIGDGSVSNAEFYVLNGLGTLLNGIAYDLTTLYGVTSTTQTQISSMQTQISSMQTQINSLLPKLSVMTLYNDACVDLNNGQRDGSDSTFDLPTEPNWTVFNSWNTSSRVNFGSAASTDYSVASTYVTINTAGVYEVCLQARVHAASYMFSGSPAAETCIAWRFRKGIPNAAATTYTYTVEKPIMVGSDINDATYYGTTAYYLGGKTASNSVRHIFEAVAGQRLDIQHAGVGWSGTVEADDNAIQLELKRLS